MNECGVKGVYIDQIAAAAPTLCFDATHGHPLGGGPLVDGGLLAAARRHPPGDARGPHADHRVQRRAVHPLVRRLPDLALAIRRPGARPFPRSTAARSRCSAAPTAAGDTKDLALRMKAGQQLVFGEQIGWLNPGLAMEPENAEFFRSVVRLRQQWNPTSPAERWPGRRN